MDDTGTRGKKTDPLGRTAKSPRQYAATLRKKGIFTIPQEVRDQVNIHEGDNMIVTVEDDRIILTPAAPLRPRDQEWFWTPEWQAGEAEADADIAAGQTTFYGSDEEFLASFDAPETTEK